MRNNFCLKIIVIFITFEVVSNQLTDRLDAPKVWYDKVGKRIQAPDRFADVATLRVSLDKPQNRGMIKDVAKSVTGFIRSSLCLTKCIWKYTKDCAGAVNCAWKCVAPTEEVPADLANVNKQNDDEIVWNTPKTDLPKPEDLTPSDIVFFFICLMKCLTKYLPFNKPRLQQFTICLSFRCFCSK